MSQIRRSVMKVFTVSVALVVFSFYLNTMSYFCAKSSSQQIKIVQTVDALWVHWKKLFREALDNHAPNQREFEIGLPFRE